MRQNKSLLVLIIWLLAIMETRAAHRGHGHLRSSAPKSTEFSARFRPHGAYPPLQRVSNNRVDQRHEGSVDNTANSVEIIELLPESRNDRKRSNGMRRTPYFRRDTIVSILSNFHKNRMNFSKHGHHNRRHHRQHLNRKQNHDKKHKLTQSKAKHAQKKHHRHHHRSLAMQMRITSLKPGRYWHFWTGTDKWANILLDWDLNVTVK